MDATQLEFELEMEDGLVHRPLVTDALRNLTQEKKLPYGSLPYALLGSHLPEKDLQFRLFRSVFEFST